MKKLFAVLLAVVMLLSLVACGQDENEETTASTTTEATTEEPTETTTEEPTETEPTETEPTETESTAIEAENTMLGAVDGAVYENSYLGIGCDLGANWYIYNETELAAVAGITEDMLSDEGILNSLETSGVAFLFYAMQNDGMATVNINMEKTVLAGLLTADTYIDASLETVETALTSAGMENLVVEKGSISFAGEERPCIVIEGVASGIGIYEIVVPIVYDSYVACITAATYNSNSCADVLAGFYALPTE